MVTDLQIWEWLKEVSDPEVPVLTIVDLGIVRSISIAENNLLITITPTYSGCPAMDKIERDIQSKLAEKGLKNVQINTTLSPAWTTDWLTNEGKRKLKEFGIAPPVDEADKNVLFGKTHDVPCPKCNATETKMVSLFGSTACKAHYQCLVCKEPFDYFKCLRQGIQSEIEEGE